MSAAEAVSVLRRVSPESRAVVRGAAARGCGAEAVHGSGLEEIKAAILEAVPPPQPRQGGKERG
jgi:hypothetical protein